MNKHLHFSILYEISRERLISYKILKCKCSFIWFQQTIIKPIDISIIEQQFVNHGLHKIRACYNGKFYSPPESNASEFEDKLK